MVELAPRAAPADVGGADGQARAHSRPTCSRHSCSPRDIHLGAAATSSYRNPSPRVSAAWSIGRSNMRGSGSFHGIQAGTTSSPSGSSLYQTATRKFCCLVLEMTRRWSGYTTQGGSSWWHSTMRLPVWRGPGSSSASVPSSCTWLTHARCHSRPECSVSRDVAQMAARPCSVTCAPCAAAADAALEKGTLDAVFLSGSDDDDRRVQLQRAAGELARTVRVGGLVVSFCGFGDKILEAFSDERVWRCLRDGSVHITDDGHASNSVNACFLAWERVG